MKRSLRPAPRRSALLMTSSALGALALTSIGTPVLADDECGPHVPGVPVECTVEDGPHDRVTYDVDADLTVTIEDGAVLNGGIDLTTRGSRLILTGRAAALTSDSSSTLHVFGSSGADVRIDVGDLSYTGDGQEALFVALVRSAVVNVGDITSTGRGAHVQASGSASLSFADVHARGRVGGEGQDAAVHVESAGSQATVTGGSVTSTGDSVIGVRAIGSGVSVSVGAVTTEGDDSDGIRVESRQNALISAGSITTAGADSTGVILSGGGSVTLDLGDVQTTGAGSLGVSTDSGSNFTLIEGHVESVTTQGDDSTGLYIYSDNIDLTGGAITTAGDYSSGAFLNGYQSVTFGVDSISTSGEGSNGVSAWAGESLDLMIGEILTQGDSALGVDAWGDGDLRLRLGRVETRGDNAGGVRAESQGDGVIAIEIEEVRTAGDGSTGVQVFSNGGGTVVNVGTVTTGAVNDEGAVSGAEAHGVEILDAGDAQISAASVETFGDRADAIRINALPNAVLSVTAGSLTTGGVDARGLHIDMSEPGAADVLIETVSTSGNGADGIRLENAGSAVIGLGAVSTQGDNAFGVWAEVRDDLELTIGSVTTAGDDAGAIRISGSSLISLDLGDLTTAGDRSVGVHARGVTVSGAIARVSTAGEQAHGVDIRADDGLDLSVGIVRTSGLGAVGVRLESASADLEARVQDVETEGAGSHGLLLTSAGDIVAQIDRVVATGAGAHGLVAVSDGSQEISVQAMITSDDGAAVDLTGNQVHLTLAEGSVVQGGEVGVRVDAATGSHLVLNGSVSSAHGAALDINGGSTIIDNLAGALNGYLDLTENDDVLNNQGRFTASGTSDFGAGHDVVNNTGRIDLAEAAGPRAVTFANLERLNNSGRIDLANGVAGDVLALSGILNGQEGNSIWLDLDLRGAPAADRIEAGGWEGVSNIVLSVQGQAGLGDTGVTIARSAMAQDGDEIVVEVADGGFVDFNLVFDEGAYRLVGSLAAPAFEPTKVAAGAQHQWTSGADVVSARFGQMRGEGGRGADGRGVQVWGQAFGGSVDIEAQRSFDISGQVVDANLSHEVRSTGLQAGVDRYVPTGRGDLVIGVLAGTGTTELRFENGDVTEYDGLGLGAYGHWMSGPLSLGALVKLDTFSLDYDWAAADLRTRSDGHTLGVRVEAAWRLGETSGPYIEPQASVSWSRTALDRLSAQDGSQVDFSDAMSLVGRLGVRAGADVPVGEGARFSPYASIDLMNEFGGDNASVLRLADEDVRVRDRAAGAWARASLGARVEGRSGLAGFVQAEGDFGDVEGFTARLGIRYSW